MTEKKVPRKELFKEDEFLLFINKMLKFVKDRKKEIGFGVTLLLAIVFGGYGINFYFENKENRALDFYEEAKKDYRDVFYSQNQNASKAYYQSKESFEKLFKKFPNTSAAKIGSLLYANMAYLAKDYKTAMDFNKKALENFNVTKNSFRNIILGNMAYCALETGDKEEAIRLFEEIVKTGTPIIEDDALFNLTILYEEKGEIEKSRDTLEKIVFVKNSRYRQVVFEELGISETANQ